MKKEEWQGLYEKLAKLHNDFLHAYPIYKSGKNKKIRLDAETKVDYAISTVDYLLRSNWQAYELLTGGENVNGFGRAIIHNEFLLPRYFGDDMKALLDSIQDKIKNM